jgi:uncharacterized membrane protein YqaE (UPF0057 family)
MTCLQVFLCVVFPPLAVADRGAGSVIIVLLLCCGGWVPGVLAALIILNQPMAPVVQATETTQSSAILPAAQQPLATNPNNAQNIALLAILLVPIGLFAVYSNIPDRKNSSSSGIGRQAKTRQPVSSFASESDKAQWQSLMSRQQFKAAMKFCVPKSDAYWEAFDAGRGPLTTADVPRSRHNELVSVGDYVRQDGRRVLGHWQLPPP